jgi:ABC-type Zn2+ transport system substrate-binding protein/surface adhesin
MAPKNLFKENDIIKVLEGTHVGKTGVIIQRNAQRHRVSFTHGCGRRLRSGLVWYRYMQLKFRPRIGANLVDSVANLVDNVEVHPVGGVQGVEEEEKEDDNDLEEDDDADEDEELEDEDDSDMEEHEDPEDGESMPEEDNDEESDSDGLFEPEVEANDASTGEESTSIVPSRVTSKTRNRVSDNEQARNVTPGGESQPGQPDHGTRDSLRWDLVAPNLIQDNVETRKIGSDDPDEKNQRQTNSKKYSTTKKLLRTNLRTKNLRLRNS